MIRLLNTNIIRKRAIQKLGIRDLCGLIKFVIQHGLTPLD